MMIQFLSYITLQVEAVAQFIIVCSLRIWIITPLHYNRKTLMMHLKSLYENVIMKLYID